MNYTSLSGGSSFEEMYSRMKRDILQQPLMNTGEWQSQDKPEASHTRELLSVTVEYEIPETILTLQDEVMPNLPWAEDHFLERISGEPLNPPPSEAWWPYRVQGNASHKIGGAFSHSYPERFWPKYAEDGDEPLRGIRYEYGDLQDVVDTLSRNPQTRQAYLPVFFPEDTGQATRDHQRVPCTLGYHFMNRGGELHCWYFIRSCDLIRHFPDDVYMAGRLTQWMARRLPYEITPGLLTMVIPSLHTFRVDDFLIKKEMR